MNTQQVQVQVQVPVQVQAPSLGQGCLRAGCLPMDCVRGGCRYISKEYIDSVHTASQPFKAFFEGYLVRVQRACLPTRQPAHLRVCSWLAGWLPPPSACQLCTAVELVQACC